MVERCVTFECAGATLVGILHAPDNQTTQEGVLIVVGGPQYRVGSHRQFVLMARQLQIAGIPVFRFDYRGMGDSTSSPVSFDQTAIDIDAAIERFLLEVPSLTRVAIFGLCDGASAAAICAHKYDRVSRLVLANPWVRSDAVEATSRVRFYYMHRLRQRTFWSKVLAGKFQLKNSLAEFLPTLFRAVRSAPLPAKQDQPVQSFVEQMLSGLTAFRGATLLLISGRDLTAYEFLTLCRTSTPWRNLVASASFQTRHFEDADHTFSSEQALCRATEAIKDWLIGDLGA